MATCVLTSEHTYCGQACTHPPGTTPQLPACYMTPRRRRLALQARGTSPAQMRRGSCWTGRGSSTQWCGSNHRHRAPAAHACLHASGREACNCMHVRYSVEGAAAHARTQPCGGRPPAPGFRSCSRGAARCAWRPPSWTTRSGACTTGDRSGCSSWRPSDCFTPFPPGPVCGTRCCKQRARLATKKRRMPTRAARQVQAAGRLPGGGHQR